MQDVLQQILDQVRGAWRFRWLALGLAWAICLAAWIIIFMLPDSYQASARVFVDTGTALSEVTKGISIETNVDTQIQRVRQAMLGAPQLQEVADAADLMAGSITPRDRQIAIEGLRREIQISGDVSRNRAGVYVISYQSRDRAKALRVVEKLLNTFVESTLGGKREGSQQAQQFLQTQIADYEQRLSSAEQRLAEFKKKNVGLMPGATGDYFSRLQAEMEALKQAEASLQVAVQRRDELQRQLRGDQSSMASPAAGGGANSGSGVSVGGDTAARIQDVQKRLDELLLKYTEKHPDVIALRQTLKDLEQRQQDELAAVRRGDPGAAALSGLATNPVFQSIQLAFNQAEVDIATSRAEVNDHRRKVAELRSLVNTAPEVEAELSRLNRDYEVTRSQYQTLVQRLEAARLGEDAEATGMVRFEVIDPPAAAFDPVAPNRPLLIIFSLVFALGAGGALAYVLHMTKPVFTNVRQLSEMSGLPVLGEVSMTWIERYRLHRRRDALAFAGGTVALVGAAAAILAGHLFILNLVKGLGA